MIIIISDSKGAWGPLARKKKSRQPDQEGVGRVRELPAAYRTSRRLSATEAARNLSELLNRVLYRGESFIIERSGEPICELRPVAPSHFTGADLVTLLRSLPPVDESYLRMLEAMTREQAALPEPPWER